MIFEIFVFEIEAVFIGFCANYFFKDAKIDEISLSIYYSLYKIDN
jgi:hypothetical protein